MTPTGRYAAVGGPSFSPPDVDTGIDLRPGNEIAFEAWDTIWAGVWGTGRNGPAGRSIVDHNPKFPLHNGPDAHPFSLIVRYEGLDWFRVGDGRMREFYSGGAQRRLFLRTNDDMPGNGDGAFTWGYGQFWGMRSGGGLVPGGGDGLAVAEADPANDLSETVGAGQSAPVALG